MENEIRPIRDLDSIICDVLKESFNVKSSGKGHFWFTPWEDRCRKVIELYPLKGSLYPLYWGYNFDFIPWERCLLGIYPKPLKGSGNLVYHRTEKSVHIDYTGQPFSYINYNFYSPSLHSYEEHFEIRNKYFVKALGTGSKEETEQIKAAVKRNVPFMLDWFDKIRSLDDIINRLNETIEDAENKQCFPIGDYWLRGFLNAKQHNIEGAVSDVRHVYRNFDTPTEIPEIVVKKIYEVDRL